MLRFATAKTEVLDYDMNLFVEKGANIIEWRKKRYILKVDLEYPESFHDDRSDLPLAPESSIPQGLQVTDSAEYVGGNIEKLFDEARQNMQRQHKTWEKYYNRKRRMVNIKVNNFVLVQRHFISAAGRRVVGKFMPKFEGPYRVLTVQNNNLTIWKRGRRVAVNIDQGRIYHPRHSDANGFDSINETLYEGKGSSNWSNRLNAGKSRHSRKPSGNEYKSCKSNKGNAARIGGSELNVTET
ncbi:uncharacterized protein TNCV_1160951 [Trichonephila clavipes]|nr:uncharacterized protein TNCV_1160951 [Trichonephila clavipes]